LVTISNPLEEDMRKNEQLTQERLKELLHYNPKTGIFIWRVTRGSRAKIGEVAGHLHTSGYIIIIICGVPYKAHILAFLYMIGQFPENQIDHKHRNRSDNRWSEIREATQSCNTRNTGNRCDNTSGVKGIHWSKSKRKWGAYININKKQKYLKCFDDFDEAVCTRLAAEQCLDWSNCDSNSPAFQYVQQMLGDYNEPGRKD